MTVPMVQRSPGCAGMQVKLVVLHALEQNSDALLRHLCLDCGLLTWIAAAPAEVELPQAAGELGRSSPR